MSVSIASTAWLGEQNQALVPRIVPRLAKSSGHTIPPDMVLSYNLLGGNGGVGSLWFLTLWPLYGFAVAQFCALVCRKTAAAVVISLLVGAVALALWLPSLVVGGVSWWQPYLLPLCLLLATRVAMWPWMSGSLATPRTVVAVTTWVLLGIASVAGSLWYRMVEFPDLPPRYNLTTFRASLPAPEHNEAGRLIRKAAGEFTDHERRISEKLGPPKKALGLLTSGMGGGTGGGMASAMAPAQPPMEDAAGTSPMGSAAGGAGSAATVDMRQSYADQVRVVLQDGWPREGTELGRWLDDVVGGDWAKHLREAAKLPPGVVVDPRFLNTDSTLPELQPLPDATDVLAAQAMHLQAQGNAGGALDLLVLILAVARNLENRTVILSYSTGKAIEQGALTRLEKWFDNLGDQPQLLRRALDELARHEAQIPPLSECLKAEYLLYFGSGDVPAGLLSVLSRNETRRDPMFRYRKEALEGAWQVPWEKERALRICRLVTAMQLPPQLVLDWAALPASLSKWPNVDPANEARDLRRIRLFRIELAARLFQLEQGKPPFQQEDLVPRYLPEPLLDPDGRHVLPLFRRGNPDDGPGGPSGLGEE
jgi:hypothetical protein